MSSEKTAEQLKLEIDALKVALNKARAINKQKFRIETTQTANNFHISFNQLFTTEQIKTDYKDLIVSENDKEIVFNVALKDKLKDRIIKALLIKE